MADNNDRPSAAPYVFLFQRDKAKKRCAEGSSSEGREDSDNDDGSYSNTSKKGRLSPLTKFPPANLVSKNNVFMPSNFCHSPTSNSDSEPEEKMVGFCLKPPTLIHGLAPSAGVPRPKHKEAPRSILRPPVLQPPLVKTPPQCDQINSLNGLKESSDAGSDCSTDSAVDNHQDNRISSHCVNHSSGVNDKVFPQAKHFKDTNYFFQYITCSTQKADNASANSAKFVFGQNMSDRVLAVPQFSLEPAMGSRGTKESYVNEQEQIMQDQTQEKEENMKESLEESAARHEAHKLQKCLLEQVQVKTGEESESNVLQMQSKLFMFEMVSQSWVERGCGVLRLNDMASTDDSTLQSRLVMRTQGSLRVILNTKIWPKMQVEKASEKNIRITALDTEEQGVKVFLISSSSKDAAQLFTALHHRIVALQSTSVHESDGQPVSDSDVVHYGVDDESCSPPATDTPASGNQEAAVCPVTDFRLSGVIPYSFSFSEGPLINDGMKKAFL